MLPSHALTILDNHGRLPPFSFFEARLLSGVVPQTVGRHGIHCRLASAASGTTVFVGQSKIRFALRKSFISNFEMASMMLSCIGMRKIYSSKIGFVSVHAVVFVDCAQVTHELPDSDLALTWLISNYSKQSDFEDISRK